MEAKEPVQHSMGAVCVGGSVIALKFKDGVIMSSDTAVSYGSMRAYKHQERYHKINDEVAVASSGEMSDFQEIKKIFQEKEETEFVENCGQFLKPQDYANYLSRVQYNRRMRGNPLFCSSIVAGVRKETGEATISYVDMNGLKIDGPYRATSLGNYFCQVLIENSHKEDMSEADAIKLLEDCQRVLFYKDKRCTDEI